MCAFLEAQGMRCACCAACVMLAAMGTLGLHWWSSATRDGLRTRCTTSIFGRAHVFGMLCWYWALCKQGWNVNKYWTFWHAYRVCGLFLSLSNSAVWMFYAQVWYLICCYMHPGAGSFLHVWVTWMWCVLVRTFLLLFVVFEKGGCSGSVVVQWYWIEAEEWVQPCVLEAEEWGPAVCFMPQRVAALWAIEVVYGRVIPAIEVATYMSNRPRWIVGVDGYTVRYGYCMANITWWTWGKRVCFAFWDWVETLQFSETLQF